jgi:hypothetical protein
MDIWVLAGFMGQVYGAYTTERRAMSQYEILKRDGVAVIEPIHIQLNKERERHHDPDT